MTRHATAACNSIPGDDPWIVGPRPDLAATQRMLAEGVTRRADRRAERNALDGKPTSAIPLGGLAQDISNDTGRR